MTITNESTTRLRGWPQTACNRPRPSDDTAESAQAQQAQEPVDVKRIAECLAVLRPKVKRLWPHEQALEELARYATQSAPKALAPRFTECRIELVDAIHTLASHYENRLGRLDPEDRKLAEGDIAHAMATAAKWNRNGIGGPQAMTTITQLLEKWEARSRDALPSDAMLINKHIRELREAVGAGLQFKGFDVVVDPTMAPNEMKLVPVEPTPEMCKAARAVPEPVKPYPPHFHLIWDAMLAAAPGAKS